MTMNGKALDENRYPDSGIRQHFCYICQNPQLQDMGFFKVGDAGRGYFVYFPGFTGGVGNFLYSASRLQINAL